MGQGGMVAVVACALAACTGVNADYGDTHYACSADHPCPDDQQCIDGTCGGAVVAGVDAAPGVDAAHFTIRRERAPHIEIPDQETGIEDTVEVPACAVAGAAVEVEITHPWRGDVTIALVAPPGQTILLKQYVDSDMADDIIGTFPDTLEPEESLDQLAGIDGEGTWTLQIADLDSGDVGTLETWALVLDCT